MNLKMPSSEDDDDYMSNEFLKPTVVGNDVCPGLLHNRTQRREHTLAKKRNSDNKKHKMRNVSIKELELLQLNKGLDSALGPDNKGFAMLQKMGFQPGSGLGVPGSSGITEPVKITMKSDRKGLGRAEALKEIKLQKEMFFRKSQGKVNVVDYRTVLSNKFRERDIMSDLHKSQKSCYSLDSTSGIDFPEEIWFWPKHCLPVDDAEDENDDEPINDPFLPVEKLEMLTIYLRRSYCYCIWCGVEYDDDKDLSQSCPGPTRDDH